MNKEERLAKDITNAVGGNHNIDNIIPVSYTHLTLPTNREV